jgi:DNA-binding NtrC family response regulator
MPNLNFSTPAMTPNGSFKILIVDDESDVQKSLQRLFARTEYQLSFADSGSEALDQLAAQPVDLMLLDLKMPQMDGLAVLNAALELYPDLPVIILTAHGTIQEAVTALKRGATDFFEKSVAPELLRNKVRLIHKEWSLRRENEALHNQLNRAFNYSELLGESSAMLRLKDMIVRIAPTDTSVLIQGESGTGKELVARAIHHHSARKAKVFIPVDCASLNETVIESELFGHVKGAFTGAEQNTLGLFRAADGGTIFLDEIGEIPLKTQAKLLRVLQEREVRPVGSTNRNVINIRVIAATNRDLLNALREGTFRQDLYYRLSAINLLLPPLRDRMEDIPLLAEHIVTRAVGEDIPGKRLSEAALLRLQRYDWQGNVRELENVLRGAIAMAAGELVHPEDLQFNQQVIQPFIRPGALGATDIAGYEEDAIRKALHRTSGSKRKTAQLLGISEATLYRRIRKYQI